jgi:hypothetical protein
MVDTTLCEKWAKVGAFDGEHSELNITQPIVDYLNAPTFAHFSQSVVSTIYAFIN